jgi:hypothetical protein
MPSWRFDAPRREAGWKSFDWGAVNRLHEKGFISNPSVSQISGPDRKPAGIRAVVPQALRKTGGLKSAVLQAIHAVRTSPFPGTTMREPASGYNIAEAEHIGEEEK